MTHYEISPREREDDERYARYEDHVDPWGYPEDDGTDHLRRGLPGQQEPA